MEIHLWQIPSGSQRMEVTQEKLKQSVYHDDSKWGLRYAAPESAFPTLQGFLLRE